jgi:hypothetical protein
VTRYDRRGRARVREALAAVRGRLPFAVPERFFGRLYFGRK